MSFILRWKPSVMPLFLVKRHMQAISSLQGSLVEIESDVGNLISEMEASIAEADAFIATMEGEAAEG